MTPLIIDTSVAVKWLNQDNEANIEQADKILNEAKARKVELFAPELLKYELGNVLLCSKKITTDKIEHLLSIFYTIPITFISENSNLAKNSYTLAKNLDITYYDASFLSIAKQFKATLVTENIKHQGKSKELKVIPLKDY